MRILYQQKKIEKDKLNLFLADLIGYKLQRDTDARNKINALSGDSRTLSAIVNVAKGSATGMTLDTVLAGIKTALEMDIFSFTLNGVNFFKLVQEKINETEGMELEVYMNPLYFASEIALKSSIIPGARKRNVDEAYINERIAKSEKAWAFHFEKDIREYIDKETCVKKILEETK